MKHTATKGYGPGNYIYRGYEIQKIEDHWNIKKTFTELWTDAANTLSDAKNLIDMWES